VTADRLTLRVTNCIGCGRPLSGTTHVFCGHVLASMTLDGYVSVTAGWHERCEDRVHPTDDGGCRGPWHAWMGAEVRHEPASRSAVLQ
jgi:hypothetical protein